MKSGELQFPTEEQFRETCRTIDPTFPDTLMERAWATMAIWQTGVLSNPSGIFVRWVWSNGVQYVYISKT